MATKIHVTVTYNAYTDTLVTFPEGKTWDDVADAYVKWGTLYVTWHDNTTWEYESLDYIELDSIDQKHPAQVEFYDADSADELLLPELPK